MRTIKVIGLLAFCFCLFTEIQGQPVFQWRGPNRDGIYPEKDLLKTWPAAGPQLLWSVDVLGTGYSSPVIAGDKLYINGEINKVSHLFVFGLNGKLLWKYANGPEFYGEGYSANFPGARSAPTVYNGLVYICSGMGRIACLDAVSGAEKWAVKLSDLGGQINMFGNSESLLVDESKVYCYPGGKETNIMALDRMTGKPVWTSKALGDPVSFCSPMMIKLPARNIFITVSYNNLLGLDAKTGDLLWSYKQDSVKLEGEHCNTPIFADGFIYGVSGDDKGNGAYKLQLSPDGKSIKEVWRNSQVLNPLGGFVKIGNRIYTSSKDNKLKVVDTENGQVTESLSGMKGNLIAADNLLFFYADNGYINLVKGIGSKLEVAGKFKITKGEKEHFSHPVIASGTMYVRHGNTLMAYQVK